DVAESSYLEGERARQETAMKLLAHKFREQIGADAYDYLSINYHLLQGSAIQVLPHLVEQVRADLVVMGTVARTGISGLIIGNTAEAILDQLKCSVLAVKPPGFVSPVTL